MRLVAKPATSLTDEQVATMFSLIKKAEEQHQSWQADCDDMLEWIKVGSKTGSTGKKNVKRNSTKLQINLGHSHVRSLSPTLFFKEPTVRAWAFDPSKDDSAEVWEALLNAYVRRTDYKRLTKKAVLTACILPEVWKKWIYVKGDPAAMAEAEDTGAKVDLGAVGGEFTDIQEAGPQSWMGTDTIVGVPIAPGAIITDCSNRTIESSRFIAVKYRKALDELKLDPRYKAGHKELSTLTIENSPNKGTLPLGKDDTRSAYESIDSMIDVWEIWVYQLVGLKLYKQVVVLAEGCKQPIRELLPWSDFLGPFVTGYPFTKLELNPIPGDLPKSELESWRDLQIALDWLFSKIVSLVQARKALYNFYPENAKNPKAAKNQLYSGNPVEFIECKDVGVPVVDAVSQQGVSNDDWNLLAGIQSLIQQVSGVGQNRRGSAGIRTATEASIIENSSKVKEDDKVDAVGEFIKADLTILSQMIRAFHGKDFVFRLVGKTGPAKWGHFTQEEAAWAPDVEIEPESYRYVITQEKAVSLQQAIATGLPLAQMYGGRFRLDILYKKLLEAINISNAQEIVNDDVPSEVKQLTEIIFMTLGLPAPVAPTDDHMGEMKALVAFTNSEAFQVLSPDVQAVIVDHANTHQEYLKNMQTQMPANTGNAFDDVLINGNAASEGRQETADTRTSQETGEF